MAEAQRSLEKSRLSFAQAEAASKTAAAAAMSAQGSLREQQVASDRAAKEKEAGAAGTRTRGSRAARPDPALPAVYLLTPTWVVRLLRHLFYALLLVASVRRQFPSGPGWPAMLDGGCTHAADLIDI